ncbi:hypothetical protein AB9P05_20825 [Roseivirga sp. BDSF3-8]|uniref:hypothetical protein n=1 Tax=Roseivirga sp. BDSF3-8 TaxID=3241598 RepID=UPI0035318D7C
MNKTRFLEILSDPKGMNDFEMQELESLVESMPYSQPVHMALAIKKNSDSADEGTSRQAVKNASLYTFDRRRLKQILQGGLPPSPKFYTYEEVIEEVPSSNYLEESAGADTQESEIIPAETEERHTEISLTSEEPAEPSLPVEDFPQAESSEVHSEIEETLRQLKAAREKSEQNEDESANLMSENPGEEIHIEEKASVKETSAPPTEEETESVEIETVSETPDTPAAYTDTRDKRREQMQLIDRFIEKSPSISQSDKYKHADGDYEGKDLSSNTAGITDNTLISENLANIMVRQGKIDRAIDIYKKLIWKFPQKKSYFASRIEELKSNG